LQIVHKTAYDLPYRTIIFSHTLSKSACAYTNALPVAMIYPVCVIVTASDRLCIFTK
jgi:hypothetical protein